MATDQIQTQPKSLAKMSSVTDEYPDNQYTITSKASMLGIVFAMLSVTSFLFTFLVILAPLAFFLGFMGLRACWKYPEEVKGKSLSYAAMGIAASVFIAAPAFHTYVFYHEVKDGYIRTTWYDHYKVKPGPTQAQYNKAAEELNGKKVFVKGYVRPGLKSTGMSEFLLVGDLSQCCFGGNPKINEIIYVKIKNDQKVDYSWRLRKIHGTFKLNRRLQKGEHVADDIVGYIYEIEADDIL